MKRKAKPARLRKATWQEGVEIADPDSEIMRKLTLWHRVCSASQTQTAPFTLSREGVESMMRSVNLELAKAARRAPPPAAGEAEAVAALAYLRGIPMSGDDYGNPEAAEAHKQQCCDILAARVRLLAAPADGGGRAHLAALDAYDAAQPPAPKPPSIDAEGRESAPIDPTVFATHELDKATGEWVKMVNTEVAAPSPPPPAAPAVSAEERADFVLAPNLDATRVPLKSGMTWQGYRDSMVVQIRAAEDAAEARAYEVASLGARARVVAAEAECARLRAEVADWKRRHSLACDEAERVQAALNEARGVWARDKPAQPARGAAIPTPRADLVVALDHLALGNQVGGRVLVMLDAYLDARGRAP